MEPSEDVVYPFKTGYVLDTVQEVCFDWAILTLVDLYTVEIHLKEPRFISGLRLKFHIRTLKEEYIGRVNFLRVSASRHTQSAQVVKGTTSVIMYSRKPMYTPGYHYTGFIATRELWSSVPSYIVCPQSYIVCQSSRDSMQDGDNGVSGRVA